MFDNGRLGMVKLEQEQGGLPELGTELDNPAVPTAMGLAARRVTEPGDSSAEVSRFVAASGCALLNAFLDVPQVS